MNDPRDHDRLPDPAALDELSRAFAADVAAEDAEDAVDAENASDDVDADVDADAEAGDAAPGASGPIEFEIVEQTPFEQLAPAVDPGIDDDADGEGAGDAGGEGAGAAGDEAAADIDRADDEPPVEAEPDVAPEPPRRIVIDALAATDGPYARGRVVIGDLDDDNVDDDVDRDDQFAHQDAGRADPGDRVGEGGTVVIEVGDDLPDPVYVEGSLDADGGHSVVLIENDDTGDTLAPDDERDVRRGIEPRMRERRIAVKRTQARKRLKWVAIIGGVVVVVVGVLAVLGSGLFAIKEDQVSVTGAVYTDPARLQAVIDDLVGTPALLADTDRAERDLEAIPWVEVARVRTDFPHAVTIEIREREPMTTYQGPDQRYRVLDREGRVLDVIDGYPVAYLLLGGPDPVDLDAGEFAPRGYAAASELAKNLTPSVRGRIEMIEVTADGSRLVMRLDGGIEVRFGEARDLFAKLVRLETVLTSGEPSESGIIDVSTSEVTR